MVTENFPNLPKDMTVKVKKDQISPARFNITKSNTRHIVIKIKEKVDYQSYKRKEANNT